MEMNEFVKILEISIAPGNTIMEKDWQPLLDEIALARQNTQALNIFACRSHTINIFADILQAT